MTHQEAIKVLRIEELQANLDFITGQFWKLVGYCRSSKNDQYAERYANDLAAEVEARELAQANSSIDDDRR